MKRTDIETNFPFLSGIKCFDAEYIGIIQNLDTNVLSIYDYNSLKSNEDKMLFLQYGDIWWSQSNRLWPINIFMQGQMDHFKYCLKTFSDKKIEILFGPATSLNNIARKRLKKRQIQLIRKIT